MTTGLKIVNNSGNILIDSNFKCYVFVSKTLVAPLYTNTHAFNGMTLFTVDQYGNFVSSSDYNNIDEYILPVEQGDIWGITSNFNVLPNCNLSYDRQGKLRLICKHGTDLNSMLVYRFKPVSTKSNATSGLRIYNELGQLVYDSGYRYLRFSYDNGSSISTDVDVVYVPFFYVDWGGWYAVGFSNTYYNRYIKTYYIREVGGLRYSGLVDSAGINIQGL